MLLIGVGSRIGENSFNLHAAPVLGQLASAVAAPQVAMYFASLFPHLDQEILIIETMKN